MCRISDNRSSTKGDGCFDEHVLRCRMHIYFRSHICVSDNMQGGNVLANGTWINVGGNQAVTLGGNPAMSQDGSSAPYHDADGRKS
jgi:hypothetical protein